MRVLISSLQVSTSGSKGHLHPAMELAIYGKQRGHETILLPLPSEFGDEDREQIELAGIKYIDPPALPQSIIKSTEQLAQLAKDPQKTWQAYHSFLVAPLIKQFPGILAIIEKINPDVVVYDMLVYGASLSARKLNIPDIGYCPGLKLVAPNNYVQPYQRYKEHLTGDLDHFLQSIAIDAEFRHLELLSGYGHLVFSTNGFIKDLTYAPKNTHLVGALPISKERAAFCKGNPKIDLGRDFALLSFGSVLDPADYMHVTKAIFDATKACGIQLLLSSRKLAQGGNLPAHVKAYPYLPLPELLPKAKIFFNHGGANSCSEALSFGTPQLIIPLTNDQPIQAHYLRESGVGLAINPNDIYAESLGDMMRKLLDPKNPIHESIKKTATEFQRSNGAMNAFQYIERVFYAQSS